MIVSLIGYRATGKTTVGYLLAERLGWQYVDTDQRIEYLVGQSIRHIFANQGEEKFRDYESQVIQELVRRHKVVLALGGGAVLRPENRQLITVAGPVVWLAATPETIRSRLDSDPQTLLSRPALTGASVSDEVDQVLRERLPIYESCADLTIATDGRTPREIVDVIMASLDLPE